MFEFVLNGHVVRVPEASADMTLLDYLRSRGLTGAKEGCAEGECGACAVVMRCGRPDGAGSEYRRGQQLPDAAAMAAGREIDTVEALAADGRLAPAQQALAAAGGSQCGYCTPGFVMSLMAEYYRPGRVGTCDPSALDGNLCRCTGYRPIADAARSLGPAPPDRFSARLEQSVPPLEQVAVDGFSRPTSVEACVALLRANPTATLVAGGTDLVVERNLRQRRWPHLVSVEAIEELHTLSDTPEWVRIGAARPLADLLRGWSDAPEAVQRVGHAVCVTADPSPRDTGWQSRDGVTHRRRRPAPAGTRRVGRDCVRRPRTMPARADTPRHCAGRLLHGIPQDEARAG